MQTTSSFDQIEEALGRPLNLTDEMLLESLWPHLARTRPDVVGLTVPFPGNLFGALRIAQAIKARQPNAAVVLGGGYVNTELRRLNEPRLFQFVDYVTLDDGERPFLCLLDFLAGGRPQTMLRRTFGQTSPLRYQEQLTGPHGKPKELAPLCRCVGETCS